MRPSPTERSTRTIGAVATVGAFALWGVMPAYWKLLIDVSPDQLVAHRTFWSLIAAAALLLIGRKWRELVRAVRSPATASRLLLSAAMLGVNWYIFIWGVNHGYVLDASLGYYINPLMSILLGRVFLAERLRRVQILSVLLATAGVANLLSTTGRIPWVALGLAATFAVYGLIRKTTDTGPLEGLTFEMTVLSVPALVLLAWLHGRGVNAMVVGPWSTRALLAGAGLITATPLLLFAHGVKRIRLSTVGFLQFIAPSCMFGQAVLMFAEAFTVYHAVTFGLIWTALAIFTWDSLRQRRRSR